jgi:hypothetical protein
MLWQTALGQHPLLSHNQFNILLLVVVDQVE